MTTSTFTPQSDSAPAVSGCPFHRASIPSTVARSPATEAVSAFVALSKFVIANDMVAEVKEAFRQRPHLVDDQPGFVRMEVFSPLDRPEEIWLVTLLDRCGELQGLASQPSLSPVAQGHSQGTEARAGRAADSPPRAHLLLNP